MAKALISSAGFSVRNNGHWIRNTPKSLDLAFSSLGQLSDEELVRLAQSDDRYAIEYLMGKFKQLVLQQVRPYYLAGADNEDLIQEGMIGLFKAIRDFSFEKSRPFASFAVLCVRRQILTAIKLANRLKCMPLNQAYSLDQPPSDDTTVSLGESLPSETERAPEEVWLDKVSTRYLRMQIKERLSPLEYESINLYAVGLNYHEIAKRLGRTSRSIDRALFRGKRKIKVLLTLGRRRSRQVGISHSSIQAVRVEQPRLDVSGRRM